MKAMQNRERESAGQHQGAAMKKGWQTKKLREVCEFDKAQGIHRGLPYVGLEHIESHTARFIGSSEPQPVKSSTFRFSDKHVLYGRLRPYLNKALAPDFDGHCSTEIFPLKPRPELSREYLLFWLLADASCDRINATCTGARMPRAQMNDVLEIEIPVPPLAEQQRIVGLLDEAFESLATAKANAEKNLQNARALFESHLQSVFTQRGLGWVEKRLEDVCVIGDGNHSSNYPKKEELVAKGVPFIRSTNLVDGEISDEDMRFLSPEKHAQLKKGHLKTGDILFTNRGEIGKTAIVDAGHEGSNLNSQIAWLRCSETLNNRFLFHVLNSGAIKSHLELSKNGAALQQFTIRQIKELKIPIPPKDQQRALVVSLDGLSSETQRLARLYERKLVALEALKRSLLHQAFSGEL